MQYFALFLVIGAILAAGLLLLVRWLGSRNIKVTWYEWLMGALGLILLLLAVQHFMGALSELFPYAAWMGLLILGLPALILLVVAWWLAWRRQRAA